MAEVNLTQIRELATKIAGSAQTIEMMAVLCVEGTEDAEASAAGCAARDLAAQVGWMADMIITKLGGAGCVGGAEEWMLPPTYLEAQPAPL